MSWRSISLHIPIDGTTQRRDWFSTLCLMRGLVKSSAVRPSSSKAVGFIRRKRGDLAVMGKGKNIAAPRSFKGASDNSNISKRLEFAAEDAFSGSGARAVAMVVAATLMATSAAAQTITDGDTLRFPDKHVRLWGIDAPEIHQECNGWHAGIEASRKLLEQAKADRLGVHEHGCEPAWEWRAKRASK
jgi:endonuclease YncB( thermonuclease family)